jgi:hypothetical protein
VHPGNLWDLKGCREKSGKSLQDYIRRFSQKYHEPPSVADADVISAFWDGMTFPWYTSSAMNNRQLPKSCSTLPLDKPLARRWLGLPSSKAA